MRVICFQTLTRVQCLDVKLLCGVEEGGGLYFRIYGKLLQDVKTVFLHSVLHK